VCIRIIKFQAVERERSSIRIVLKSENSSDGRSREEAENEK